MAGAQFEYDERGNTFYYVLISFYLFLLLPLTYFLWPRKPKSDASSDSRRCHCDGCDAKEHKKRSKQPWSNVKRYIKFVVILFGWALFAVLLYKISTIEVEHVEWDPYKILGLDRGASIEEIKRAYRRLSREHHPDKGGDEKKFVEITKANAALTNEESRENYEKYGNPDGPGATTFGIALPKWIVSKEYGIFVLAAYGVVFMIILPSGVGIWWYNSIKYSADQVLMDTTQLFMSLFYRTPNMILRRAITVMSGAFEFWRIYNKEIIERPSDDREVPQLIKDLPKFTDNVKDRPLCFPYAVKARAIMHAHLYRIPMPPDTLENDRALILHKIPLLVQEMIQVYSQLVMFANTGRINRMPLIDTLENVMRLMPMFVQASWESRSSLLQLPHFTEDMLRHCITKKRRVRTCQDLALMPDQERRLLLRNLSDSQYDDLRTVLMMMPRVECDYSLEVPGEDDKHTITAGSLVTVRCRLKRTPLLDAAVAGASGLNGSSCVVQDDENEDDGNADVDENDSASVATTNVDDEQAAKQLIDGDVNDENKPKAPTRKPWEKPQKKKKGKSNNKRPGAGGGAQKKKPQQQQQPAVQQKKPEETNNAKTVINGEQQPASSSTKPSNAKPKKSQRPSDDEDSDVSYDSEDDLRAAVDEANQPESDDEETLAFDDDLMKKERVLEAKSKVTHPVHSPYFPEEKYEWWWVYLCERKRRLLVAPPQLVTTLIDEEEVELRFPAPHQKGTYTYQMCIRSDSYMDADLTRDIKFDVHEARQVTSHPQWEFNTDDEMDEKKSDMEHSDADSADYTEDEGEDDE